MVEWDGHEVAIFGSVSGFYAITNGVYGKGWIKSMIHRQPIVAMSFFLGGLGIALPIVVVPIRRRLGLPTNQYDASHPKCVFPVLEE
mmetsp:Transcript_16682/g.34182  ORF Transcript_16682/g.34182 Transcript_16682/m.34182 type:complete len:87 (-) Transcript_16682:239-499(-)